MVVRARNNGAINYRNYPQMRCGFQVLYAQLEIEYSSGNLVPLFFGNILANLNGIKANQMIVIVHILHN